MTWVSEPCKRFSRKVKNLLAQLRRGGIIKFERGEKRGWSLWIAGVGFIRLGGRLSAVVSALSERLQVDWSSKDVNRRYLSAMALAFGPLGTRLSGARDLYRPAIRPARRLALDSQHRRIRAVVHLAAGPSMLSSRLSPSCSSPPRQARRTSCMCRTGSRCARCSPHGRTRCAGRMLRQRSSCKGGRRKRASRISRTGCGIVVLTIFSGRSSSSLSTSSYLWAKGMTHRRMRSAG